MNALERFATFVQSRELANPTPGRFERLKRHVLDTIGARLAGSRTDEGAAADRAARSTKDDTIAAILSGCAQARCTEADDVHLTSCTTPGAVIVPTALALAESGELRSMRAFTAAAVAGYEAMLRLGVAIDGPTVLHEGVWPTYRVAAFGSAAVASRAYGLTVHETTAALAASLGIGAGPAPASAPAMSARWIALGIAAVDGVLAVRGAREGLTCTTAIAARPLTSNLGEKWLFDEIGLKPYPTARQALAAIEAVRELMTAEGLDATALPRITDIIVSVPDRQRAIIDRPEPPLTRFSSIVSVQYQIALDLVAPDRIADARRTPVFMNDLVRRMMAKVRVRRARDLDRSYPREFPAHVTIAFHGRRLGLLVRHPRGDHRNPLGWDDVERKFHSNAGLDPDVAGRYVQAMRSVTLHSDVPALWELR
jgi:2-methylcitrate dehydratase PrpD